ncbi:hypothetical protein SH1V18_11160 [Vallitalea longa]|uniref:Uncharacterized protein n=1 Tax=Vallitalea longa TaxID=2936439 RepID=A0A9W6DDD5_9FIRM|nr:hypothetical protein [Vallitalea longa]GKX28636.1 hypothetical protein SH1V18_11160 [Vallitalea longa]
MENEVNSIMKQAVILIVIGFVVSICWVTVSFGQHLYRNFNNQITNSLSYAYSSELDSIMNYTGDLPAACVYYAAEKNKASVESISGYYSWRDESGKYKSQRVRSIKDLKKLFQHQINCTITKSTGKYRIVIY